MKSYSAKDQSLNIKGMFLGRKTSVEWVDVNMLKSKLTDLHDFWNLNKRNLTWFPFNIRTIIEKIKLLKKTPSASIIFWMQLKKTNRKLSSWPRERKLNLNLSSKHTPHLTRLIQLTLTFSVKNAWEYRPFLSSLSLCLCFKASLSAKPSLWKLL